MSYIDVGNDVICTEHTGTQTFTFLKLDIIVRFFGVCFCFLFISLRAIRSLHVCIFSFLHYQYYLTRLNSVSEAYPADSLYLALRETSYII
jgi:hypothetical protein